MLFLWLVYGTFGLFKVLCIGCSSWNGRGWLLQFVSLFWGGCEILECFSGEGVNKNGVRIISMFWFWTKFILLVRLLVFSVCAGSIMARVGVCIAGYASRQVTDFFTLKRSVWRVCSTVEWLSLSSVWGVICLAWSDLKNSEDVCEVYQFGICSDLFLVEFCNNIIFRWEKQIYFVD